MSHTKNKKPKNPSNWISIKLGQGQKRSFMTFKWRANCLPSEITRSEAFWHVRSTFNEDAMIRYLRLKYFWNELQGEQIELAFDHPRFLRSVEFNVLLALLANTELTRLEISIRAERALSVLNRKSEFRFNLLSTWDQNIRLVAERETRTIRPHKRFSGWVRNASALGSKHKTKVFIPDPLFEEYPEESFDEFEFLYGLISVGNLESNTGILRLS